LFLTYRGLVAGVANRLLDDATESVDVTQDVFLKVFRNICGFRGDSGLKTWIFKIAMSEAKNRQRSWRRRYRFQMVTLDERLTDCRPSPHQELEAKEQARRVYGALDRLSHDRRAILVLRDIEGLPYGDIAANLGISTGTVKSRLARARAEMKRILTNEPARSVHSIALGCRFR
jgi:RNA polymerase sigma-70 factor (ECF subfamily)